MKFPWGPFPIRPVGPGVLAFTLWSLALHSQAANLNVRVSDVAGKSLPNAVLMLEPLTGKLPVAPMQGVEISQVKRQFTPQLTVVTVGTPVSFPNADSVRHHVYSFSPIKAFELKLYSGVPTKPVVFDKAGVAVIGCNIHDSMVAWVVVVDTPFHAVSATGGKAQLASVPTGLYQLKVWHGGLRAGQAMSSTAIQVGQSDLDQEVRLDIQGNEQ